MAELLQDAVRFQSCATADSRIFAALTCRWWSCWTAPAELGLETVVSDEGRYAEQRDVELLRREIREWNELIAGLAGVLKDALPGEVDPPISEFPDFEHLEARGREKWP